MSNITLRLLIVGVGVVVLPLVVWQVMEARHA